MKPAGGVLLVISDSALIVLLVLIRQPRARGHIEVVAAEPSGTIGVEDERDSVRRHCRCSVGGYNTAWAIRGEHDLEPITAQRSSSVPVRAAQLRYQGGSAKNVSVRVKQAGVNVPVPQSAGTIEAGELQGVVSSVSRSRKNVGPLSCGELIKQPRFVGAAWLMPARVNQPERRDGW